MASRSLSISHPPSLPLHRLSQTVEKRLIIMSIHQPRYSIFSLFTSLTLLSQGHLVYHGKAQQVLPYFHSLGQIHVHIPQIIHRLIVDLGKVKEKVEEFNSGIVTENQLALNCNSQTKTNPLPLQFMTACCTMRNTSLQDVYMQLK